MALLLASRQIQTCDILGGGAQEPREVAARGDGRFFPPPNPDLADIMGDAYFDLRLVIFGLLLDPIFSDS